MNDEYLKKILEYFVVKFALSATVVKTTTR